VFVVVEQCFCPVAPSHRWGHLSLEFQATAPFSVFVAYHDFMVVSLLSSEKPQPRRRHSWAHPQMPSFTSHRGCTTYVLRYALPEAMVLAPGDAKTWVFPGAADHIANAKKLFEGEGVIRVHLAERGSPRCEPGPATECERWPLGPGPSRGPKDIWAPSRARMASGNRFQLLGL
jgi:hypothetical protein